VPAANKTALAALLKKKLEDRAQAGANKPPVVNVQPNKQTENIPSQSRTIVETAQHVSASPQQTHKLHGIEGHVNDGYDSEEYESIKENVSVLTIIVPTVIVPTVIVPTVIVPTVIVLKS
jgi:hypothetical protein